MPRSKKQQASQSQRASAKGAQPRKKREKVQITPVSAISPVRTRRPVVKHTRDGAYISHSELVTSVAGVANGDYTIHTLPLNPGLPEAFPWLSGVAGNFQLYHFDEVKIEYKNRIGYDVKGSILMGYKYDVDQEPPETEHEFMSHDGTSENVVYRPQVNALSIHRYHTGYTKRYVRGTFVSDMDKYDGAYFIWATEGTDSADALGKMWVHYKVHLYSPQSVTQRQPTKIGDRASYCTSSDTTPIAAGSNAIVPFDTPDYDNIRPLVHDAKNHRWTARSPMQIGITPTLHHKGSSNNTWQNVWHTIKKNGTEVISSLANMTGNGDTSSVAKLITSSPTIIDLDTDDYLEIYQHNGSDSGGASFLDGLRTRVMMEVMKTGVQMLLEEGGAVVPALASQKKKPSFESKTGGRSSDKLLRDATAQLRQTTQQLAAFKEALEMFQEGYACVSKTSTSS